jgi:hypothetical protein
MPESRSGLPKVNRLSPVTDRCRSSQPSGR